MLILIGVGDNGLSVLLLWSSHHFFIEVFTLLLRQWRTHGRILNILDYERSSLSSIFLRKWYLFIFDAHEKVYKFRTLLDTFGWMCILQNTHICIVYTYNTPILTFTYLKLSSYRIYDMCFQYSILHNDMAILKLKWFGLLHGK